jgi:hypothetical protein
MRFVPSAGLQPAATPPSRWSYYYRNRFQEQKMTDWLLAWQKASRTANWAVTMTKVRIRKTIVKTRWQLVTFIGPKGKESVGIIDLMAIRKNHAPGKAGLKRGDLFEVVLIQVKGGTAPFPSSEEVERLRLVGQMYVAKAILLAQWRRGKQVEFYYLGKESKSPKAGTVWRHLTSPAEVFH